MAIGAILGAAAVSGATSYMGGKSSSDAAKKAQELDYLQYMQRRKDVKPWMEAGQESSNVLRDLMESGYFETAYDPSKIAEDPAYQFRLAEGQKAIDRGSAASGEFFSGQRGKALGKYGQNLAAEEYARGYGREQTEKAGRFGRLSDVSGRGYSAASGLQGPNSSPYALMAGQARTGGIEGMGEALQGGIQNYMLQSYLKPSGGVTGGTRTGRQPIQRQ